jgi:DNA polymerase III delta prime subunit
MSLFTKATRTQTKLRLALTGPAGSGKTLSALKLARGLVGPNGKIAVIDTENGSASYYSGQYDFDAAQMSPPYLISKYTGAITEAAKEGYDVVIVDSLSHAWSGEGGILQKKEQMDSRGGNSFANWGKLTPEQNALVNAVLHSTTNIICTMRSKTEYSLEKDDKGKATPKKLGLAPVQRDGFEYEFDIVLDVDLDTHTAKASKDRTGIFAEHIFKVEERHGKMIADWQNGGTPPEPPKKLVENTAAPSFAASAATQPSSSQKNIPAELPASTQSMSKPTAATDVISPEQVKRLYTIVSNAGWSNAEAKAFLQDNAMGVLSAKDILKTDYERICNYIEKHPKVKR